MSLNKEPETKQPSSITEGHPIAEEAENLVKNVDAIAESLPLMMAMMQVARKKAGKEYEEFLIKHGEFIEEKDHSKLYRVPLEHGSQLTLLRRNHESTQGGSRIIPRTLVVSLVSHYDYFLGKLLQHLFVLKPEMLNAVDRNLSFTELTEFSSIEAAREYVVEKEIEGVLRRSHPDQFEWMENRFGLRLRKDLPIWPEFVELTERRNLFVHTGGVVSSHYLTVCATHGVQHDNHLAVGDNLDVTPKYFKNACSCLLEISTKLAQVLWRKVDPKSMEIADRSLIEVTYELLDIENYELAKTLLDFGVNTLKTHSSDEDRRILLVNLAQSYKWLGEPDACSAILNAEDWSSSSDKFKLGVAVLQDDFDEAVQIMKRIGADGEVKEGAYKTWPLFQEFRKSEHIEKAFEEIFEKPFSTFESVE